MSDIDDLLDDFDKGELVKPSKTTAFARQGSFKANQRDEDNRVNSRNELEFLEEIMEQYGDNDAGLFDANDPDDTDQGPGSLTNLRSGKSTKKKVDRSAKLKDKMGKMLKEKKTGIDKNKFTQMMTSDPFSKPKPEPKPEIKIEKQEVLPKEIKPPVEEYKERYVAPKPVENANPTSLNSLDVPGKGAQETGPGSRVLSQKPDDNISSIHELEKGETSGINPSSMPFESDSDKELPDGKGDSSLGIRPDNSRFDDGIYNQGLQENVDSTQGSMRRKKEDNSFLEEEANERMQKMNNNRLELDLLQSKPMSILKEQTPYDIFVPGNQKIIKSYRSKLKGKPDMSAFHEIEAQRARMNEDFEQTPRSMNYSMINVPETPLEKFEREDYEAACPLSVDEHIKNFLVSENPSEEEYSVPLTKLAPHNQLSRPFFLSFGGQTTSFGKPRSISRISNSVVLIGTSYGHVCGFDVVKNTLLFKLGETKESTYGGVTAMDYREDGKFLVAGYENGNLAVFDIVKKSVVKTINNLHEAAIVALKIVMNEPLQYLSVDTSGIVMLNELEKMMMLYNQDNYCIFSKSANLNFLQLEILNHRYSTFTKGNKSGDEEMVIAYAATQQIVITTLEPISKTKRVLLKYPRPPMVYDGAIPHICWYECQAPTRLGMRGNENPLDAAKRLAPENSPGLGREALEGKYWLLMAWGFCIFIIEMRTFESQVNFEELGFLKFGCELIHIQLLDKQMVYIVDSSLFVHLMHIDDIRNHQDFYLPTGKKKNSQNEEGRIYSERLDFADEGDIVFQTSFFFKDPSGNFVKMYQNTINTNRNQKECLILHSKNVYTLRLNTWRDVLDEIEGQKNWLKLFTVGLALYHNTIKEIYQVPNEIERKDQLRDYFKDKLRRFITSQLMGRGSATLPNKKHLVEEVTLTLIDFCLETEMEEFLFTDAKQCMATLGFRDIFMKSLEPFIRWNKIHTFPTFDSLKEVISFFYENGKISITQQLIASLDLDRLGHDERELFMLSLMTMCLETNLFTALLYLCIKGTENFTLPFFTFLKLAFEADMKGKSSEKKKYVLRCLWYIKTIFKRKVVFQEDFIPEEKTKRILRDLIVLFMESSNLKVFCDVDPKLTTVLVGMLFTGEISLFMEDLYEEIQLSGIGAKQEELKNNLHFQILNKVVKFYEEYFGVQKERERRAYIAFIVSKVVENQRHKFLNEHLCVDTARYMIKHHSDLDDLIILDYKLSLPSLTQHSISARKEAYLQISEQFLVERKGTMIERMLLYARHLVNTPETVNELIRTCEANTIFAEPLCYLLSLRKEYNACLTKYLNPLNPKKTKNKAIQWVITTMMQLMANRDPTLEQFKQAVYDKIDDLVMIDPETTTSLINNYFGDEIKNIINKLSTRPDVQMSFIEKLVHEAKTPQMVDDETIELYIKLLAESKNKASRKRVLVELKKQGRYPQRCLEICKQNNIKDAWAFLEETRGTYESIKTAIELRYMMLDEYIQKCLNSKQHRLNAKQERKIRERFEVISTIIQNHFIDNNELWFTILEKILGIGTILERYNASKPKQEALKNLFDELTEKRFVDPMIGHLPYDVIITELSKRSRRISSSISRKMLVRLLRNNNYDQRFSEDARKMQSSEVTSFMNVNIIPYEVKAISLTNRCAHCFKNIDYEPSILFNCGHIYHANEISKSDEMTCELCSSSEMGIVSKIFQSKTKKTPGQAQMQAQPRQEKVENYGSHDRMTDSDIIPRKNSALNAKALKSIRFETRFTAIDRSREKLKNEVNDLVSTYLLS